MKITRENLKNIVREAMVDESAYQEFFKKALEKAGKSIPDMSDEEKKEFFNKIDAAWSSKGEKKNEGNAFGAAVSDAKEKGEDEFEVDGEKFKVESNEEDLDEEAVILSKRTAGGNILSKLKEEAESLSEGVWSAEQERQVALLDSQFRKYLSAKGIEPTSIDASKAWKKYGFQDKMRKIFGKAKYESVTEGKKVFSVNPGIGNVKYSISSHDGVKKHKDGSDFFDIKTFKNKVDLEKAIKDYTSKGFKMESVNEESINEADVVGKTIFSDGKGKLFFGYYKTDDAVEFVDYKTWKKLSFKDVSKGNTNKERVIKAILKNQKQFNKKVDFNMWAKKNNPSFEQTMDWFIQNGWISNINKGGIKESVDVLSVNELQLKKGDKVRFKNGEFIYILGPKGDGYDYSDGGERGHHPKGWFDMMIKSKKAVVESVNEAIDIKVGDMVKVDNPHWEGALGKKGPFRRKVKAIYDDNVFFTDGSNSSMKYIKK